MIRLSCGPTCFDLERRPAGGLRHADRTRLRGRPPVRLFCCPRRGRPRCHCQAGCPSGQWERTVNPSRKLRRFESFTRHWHRERLRRLSGAVLLFQSFEDQNRLLDLPAAVGVRDRAPGLAQAGPRCRSPRGRTVAARPRPRRGTARPRGSPPRGPATGGRSSRRSRCRPPSRSGRSCRRTARRRSPPGFRRRAHRVRPTSAVAPNVTTRSDRTSNQRSLSQLTVSTG
jgi:hypothetical protein